MDNTRKISKRRRPSPHCSSMVRIKRSFYELNSVLLEVVRFVEILIVIVRQLMVLVLEIFIFVSTVYFLLPTF